MTPRAPHSSAVLTALEAATCDSAAAARVKKIVELENFILITSQYGWFTKRILGLPVGRSADGLCWSESVA